MAASLDEDSFGYSRAAAILDGSLIDATAIGQRCGYPLALAISFDLKEAIGAEDFETKLVLLLRAIRLRIMNSPADSSLMIFQSYPLQERPTDILLEVGLDDEGAPCLTLMNAGEI